MVINTRINKNEFKPISKDGDKYKILWDCVPCKKSILDEEGNPTGEYTEDENYIICKEFVFNYKPSLGLIKNIILDAYNKDIDNKILSGFTWNGMPIWLSTENQFNYKAAYDLAVQTNGQNLPLIMKFGTTNDPVYHQFDSVEEFTGFYLGAMQHIQMTLAEGWSKKDSINWDDYILNDE